MEFFLSILFVNPEKKIVDVITERAFLDILRLSLKKSIYCSISFCQAGRIYLPHTIRENLTFKQIERWDLFVSTQPPWLLGQSLLSQDGSFRFITILRIVTQISSQFCLWACWHGYLVDIFGLQICRVSWCAVGAGQCFFIPEELLMSVVQCAMHSPLSHLLVSVLFSILMLLREHSFQIWQSIQAPSHVIDKCRCFKIVVRKEN